MVRSYPPSSSRLFDVRFGCALSTHAARLETARTSDRHLTGAAALHCRRYVCSLGQTSIEASGVDVAFHATAKETSP